MAYDTESIYLPAVYLRGLEDHCRTLNCTRSHAAALITRLEAPEGITVVATPPPGVTVGAMPVSYGCLLFTVCSGTQYSYSFSDLSGTGDVFIPISDQVGVATFSSVSELADATLITDPATIATDWPGPGNVIPSGKSIFDDPAGLLEVPENGSMTLSFSFDDEAAPVNGPILADGNLLDPLVPGPASVPEPSTISLLAMALVWMGLPLLQEADRRRKKGL